MTKQTEFNHPPAGHVGTLGYDSADDHWQALAVDDNGRIAVNVNDWPTTPVVYSVTMTLAATEYSQALPAGCRKFTVQCRGAYDVKLCFTASGSGTTYITVKKGCSYWEDQIDATSKTLYFQCATAAQVLEIVAWT